MRPPSKRLAGGTLVLIAVALVGWFAATKMQHSLGFKTSFSTPKVDGGWSYRRYSDKMTDRVSFKAISVSDPNNRIFMGCDVVGSNSLYFFFRAGHFLGDGNRPLEWRIDNRAVENATAEYDKNSADVFEHAAAMRFINQLRGGKTLLIRAYTFEFEQVNATIDISNASHVIDRLLVDCKD